MKPFNNKLLLMFLIWIFAAGAITSYAAYSSFQQVDEKTGPDKQIRYAGKNINFTIRDISGPGYRGKVMEVKSKKAGSIKVTLARGGLGSTETTSSMAKRTGAVAAVNGGGFYNLPVAGKPHNYPVYITIHEGRIIYQEQPVRPMITVGIDKKGKLVYSNKGADDLIKRGFMEAVSFKPALIVNGRPAVRSKGGEVGPRTAVGQKKNGEFIFLVIDGRQPGWSTGVTLYQLMIIMKNLGAYNAFNLDGGGSSTMVYRGKVLNRPSDITGERPVATSWCIYD